MSRESKELMLIEGDWIENMVIDKIRPIARTYSYSDGSDK